jgi:4-aminobutyrate aminotransferase-like enzyme
MAGPATYYSDAHASELDTATRDLVERRERVLGSAYRLFYDHPVQFVRALGTKLWDADGREYLDAYNNVPSVGHAHPRVVAAMAEKAATLNTHTRYLDEGIVTYAEEIVSTMPAHIGNVMFTCTGSEANDLALRIAKHATGGTGVIVTENAYHGVTTEVAAISPSLGGPSSIADWVELVPGSALEPSGDLGASVRAAIARLEARGIRLAALILDTVFASDGVFPEVVGFADAVAATRAAGGLFIADEVQPGFGRLGHGLWGFDRAGVSPDIVTVGKPMGNGQPIAAVLARPELIDDFGRAVRYFNTFGGSNVSIAAAQATLDVVRDEGLIENARVVGDYLASSLRGLGLEVRQAGLFLGVQLASMHETLRIVNALRERGVLLAASGPGNDSLKIRPPLVFSRADADRLLTELGAVL